MGSKTISIGGASGFWGDSNLSAHQLVASRKLDYLVFDYLAEVTMSIMARARSQKPDEGYAPDFVSVAMSNTLAQIAEQGIKVISNAGGVNPIACGQALEALVQELGLNLKVATVTGDDVSDQVDALRAQGVTEMFTGEAMPGSFMSVNAYLGAFPIAAALAKGADIVVTGRCVDSAVTLGACIHEFGWTETDYDKLAGGCLAGHIIECGAQATGGLLTDWEASGRWEDIGYPIAEISEDGSFAITKPEGTGGVVNRMTVAEQLVYEIGDPQAYFLPDVVCDFSRAVIEEDGTDRVRVSGAAGHPPTESLKVSATWKDGYRIGAYVTVRGVDAAGKARKIADAVLKRMAGLLKQLGAPPFTETSVEILGTEAGYGPHARDIQTREVVLKLAAKHPVPMLLMTLLRELTSAGTSMAPGLSTFGGNRPKPAPVVRLFSMLIDKAAVLPKVHLGGETWEVPFANGTPFDPATLERPAFDDSPVAGDTVEVPLMKIAHGRSGDKGNDANIGIIARDPAYYPVIREVLTAEKVRAHFSYLMTGHVERFDLPGICAVNFLLHESLGGGGMNSLWNDPQGKAFAQILLDIPVAIPKAMADTLP